MNLPLSPKPPFPLLSREKKRGRAVPLPRVGAPRRGRRDPERYRARTRVFRSLAREARRARPRYPYDLAKRRYFARGEILRSAGYDPATDVALSSEGCWLWNSPKTEMHQRVRAYFEQRDEDGE